MRLAPAASFRRPACRVAAVLAGALAALPASAAAAPPAAAAPTLAASTLTRSMRQLLADQIEAAPMAPEHFTPCVAGMAGSFPCHNVDLLEFLPLASIGGAATSSGYANDLWGWTDPLTGKEYALVGLRNGTSFVDISNPTHPVYLGKLPTHTCASGCNASGVWRDIKVYQDHAFIVADGIGHHGMQVFDLTQLRAVATPPVTFAETAHYPGLGSAHNIAINEASGFAYIVGGSTSGHNNCSGGLHMVDIGTPAAPQFAGCFSADGYTHDVQCVTYDGPDPDYAGREICFASNTDTVTIVDVTDKGAPLQVSRTPYAGSGYTHQGWLTEDLAHFLVDDELDEQQFGHPTRTYVWDVRHLAQPVLLGHFESTSPAIDHNQYVKGDYSYQANYRSGLRILQLIDLDATPPAIVQAGFFDVYPANDAANFNGAWSVYPYFPSGVVVVSGIEQGLFVLQPNLCSAPAPPGGLAATPAGDNRIDLAWTGSGAAGASFTVERAQGGCGGAFETLATGLALPAFADTSASGAIPYGYRVLETSASGCPSVRGACATATTTGACTAYPTFAGLATATTPGTSWCTVELSWAVATPTCSGPVGYSVYRSTESDFTPSAANRIASGLAGTFHRDFGAPAGVRSYYVVRAVDLAAGAEDPNVVRRSVEPVGAMGDGTFATGAEVGDPPLDTAGDIGNRPEHAGWHFGGRARTGLRSFWSEGPVNSCIALVTPPLELSPGESSELRFWSARDIEAGDGGVVELRVEGGPWQAFALAPDYPGTMASDDNACGLAAGRGAFTGTDIGWQEHVADLSAHAGAAVEIRFRFSTDLVGGNGEGWYLDDLSVVHAQLPGTCEAGVGIFSDDFELGSVVLWSSVEGLTP